MSDGFNPSVFTPFLRRFTDERMRDLQSLRAFYAEVRRMHDASPYKDEDQLYKTGVPIFRDLRDGLPEALGEPFSEALARLLNWESTIFDFPEIRWDIAQLSLKEQVDLERFLTAKRHFLTNQDRVADLLQGGLFRLFQAAFEDLPAFADASLFTIPLICAHPQPKKLLDTLYGIVWTQSYIDNGVFVELGRTMHANLCAVSKITDPQNPKNRPYLIPSENDGPVQELVEVYFKNTPLHDLLMAPVPLRLTHEDRFSHMHVVGGSGAGKTQLLQNLILHDLSSDDPPSLVIVDSQGDLIDKLLHLKVFDPDGGPLADRLVLITPKDTQHPPALNIFDVKRDRLGHYDDATREQVVAGVIQTFEYVFSGLFGADLTAKQDVFFRFVARLMLALPETMGRSATILDMIALMDDPAPYGDAIASLPPIQRNFFERDFVGKTFTQTKEQIRYRLNAILENPTLARLFTSPTTKIDIFDILNNGGIVLVDTAKDFLKGASAHFGRIFISLVLQAILERAVIPENKRKSTFLIVDEAAAYFDSNIDDFLTEARKYRCGCLFAHQFLDQATGALRASLAANTAIKMAGGVSTNDARALAPDMRTNPQFILSQPRLHFASYIRGVTPSAVSIPVAAGELERQPRVTAEAYGELRKRNQWRVSDESPDRNDGFTFDTADLHSGETGKSESCQDPSAASKKW